MTVHKTIFIYIRRRRVSVAKVYCSISENFLIAYPNGTRQLSVVVTPAYGEVEAGGVVVLPVHHSMDGWRAFERNGGSVMTPDARFGDNISVARCNGRGPDSFLKGSGYSSRLVCAHCSLTDSHSRTPQRNKITGGTRSYLMSIDLLLPPTPQRRQSIWGRNAPGKDSVQATRSGSGVSRWNVNQI